MRRLKEEMGIENCPLQEKFSFVYRADFADGLTEYEFDHVFTGVFNGEPIPNPEEVMDWKWMRADELKTDIVINPERYTYWIKEALAKVLSDE
jgi:isopentenyl-diphosphate delta-isomerase